MGYTHDIHKLHHIWLYLSIDLLRIFVYNRYISSLTTERHTQKDTNYMTKKDYIIIAKQFKNALDILDYYNPNASPKEVITAITKDMANVMLQDNPRFDRQRFLTACGITSEF